MKNLNLITFILFLLGLSLYNSVPLFAEADNEEIQTEEKDPDEELNSPWDPDGN